MTTCTYCDSDAILQSGKTYCSEHICICDTPAIISMLPLKHSSDTKLKEFFKWAFGTTTPRFSDFPKLYHKIERGKWLTRFKQFDKPQDIFLLEAYVMWLKEKGGSE